MIRPILRYGDAGLHRPTRPVAEVTPEVEALIDDLIDTMYAASGVGIAAPQIGSPWRVFVADPSGGRDPDALVVMVNPELVARDGEQREDEGCLSVPGFSAPVPRPARAVVRGLDRGGAAREVEGTGVLARTFAHELDHLDGALFLDRIRGLRREMLLRKINKRRRAGAW